MATKAIWLHCGDSITGCRNNFLFQALGLTSRGDCATSARQAITSYAVGNLVFQNFGVGGTRFRSDSGTDNCSYVIDTYIKPIIQRRGVARYRPSQKFIVSCGIGSNDSWISSYGSVSLYLDAVTAKLNECRDLSPSNVNLVMFTGLPRADVISAETNRALHYGYLTDSSWRASKNILRVIRPHLDSVMGLLASCSNAAYYSDTIHPTATGDGLIATTIAADVAGVFSDLGISYP